MYGLIQITGTHPIRKLMAYFWLPFSVAMAVVAIIFVGVILSITSQPKAKVVDNRSSQRNQTLEYNKVVPATNQELPLASNRLNDKQPQSTTSEATVPTSSSSASSNKNHLKVAPLNNINHL